jgi:flagellar M-ring protein FliF
MPEGLRNWLERTGRGRSIMILAAGGAAIAAIMVLARMAAAPTYVPLLPGGLDLAEIGAVTAKLEEEGIDYRLEKGGAEVQVAESELARARVTLARDGLPSKGSPGFELFDRPAWGMTDFTQRINYRRALEGELERTIGEMRGVESARVHIALNESSGFRRASRPEAASVVLTTRGGGRPSGELVEAIASMVASSVDGLESDRVTVLDAGGHLLTAAVEPGSTAGLTRRQLQYRREVEQYLENKADDLLARTLGAGNTTVRVAAELNFDKVDRTTQTVDPEVTVTLQEETSNITPSPGQVGAASSAQATTYETTRTLETFSGASGTVRRLTVAVVVNDGVTGEGDDAVPVARTPQELTRIETLVANAVGLDRERGDQITVLSAPFATTPTPVTEPVGGPSFLVSIPRYRNEIFTGIGLLLAFILGLQVVRALRMSVPQAALAGAPGTGALPKNSPRPEAMPAMAETAAIAATSPHAATLKRSAESPDISAKVLKAWMKES